MTLQQNILTFMHFSFEVRNRAHIIHFQTRNNAQHQTLGDFYDKLLDLVDEVCEAAISHGVDLSAPFKLEGVPAMPDANAVVRRYADYVVTLKKEIQALDTMGHFDGIQSLLDDIIVLCNRTVFRLQLV